MKKFLLVLISILALFSFSCDSWMNDDDFYSDIEYEVKVANAPQINVYVRYAMTRQGKTDPDGTAVFKVGIPHEIAATTEPEYGFVRWAAFTTDYLAAGDNQSKNKDVYFIDDEDYNTRLAPHELSSEIVTFEDAKNPTTVVTINEERNDLFLVPIIAHRPTVSLTIPAKGSSNVVKNMSVRINFSKPMNPASFKNEVGEFDKITITQGIQTFTSDGDIELTSEDITDHFDFNDSMFSANKKMITIKFKPEALDEGFASQSTVIVTVSKDVTDAYGYAMTEDNEINFNVGSRKDQLAPRITWLTAGTAANFQDFEGVYKDVETIEKLGEMTKVILEGSDKAPKEDIANEYFDGYVVNRVGTDTKLVLRVFAEDLAGAGSGQSLDGYESDVTQLVLRARHLYNSDGSKSELADAEAKAKYYSYVPQMNNSSVTGSYRDLITKANAKLEARDVNKDKDEKRKLLDYSYGTLVEYDLKDLPDGLIQVDVAAVDVVQNNGFFDGGSYSDEYGNAWASIFVVKDTTAPDAAANKDYVTTLLSDADENSEFYDFYNANTFSKLAVKEAPAGAVHDNGHARLVALNSNLKWLLVQGEDTSWASSLSTEDKRWALVSDGYKPSDTSLPADGSVAFNIVIMDDMGNISTPVALDSIMYDNTAPSLGTLGMTGVNGYISGSVKGNILENQVLSIPVTDETAGLKAITLSITCVSGDSVLRNEYATPFANSELDVKVNDEAVNYTISGNRITFASPVAGGSTVKIQGLQIADANDVQDNSTYRIHAKIMDAALNETSSTSPCDIGNDSTPPVVHSVKVKKLVVGKENNGADEYWTTEQTPYTNLYLSITESNTGIDVFNFAGSTISVTNSTTLTYDGVAQPITVDTTNNTIKVTSAFKADPTKELVITNVHINETAASKLKLVVSDLVKNNSSAKTEFVNEASTSVTEFKYDASAPSTASVSLVDAEQGNASTGGFSALAGYTNEQTINASFSVSATSSGVSRLTVSGAYFNASSKIYVNGSTDPIPYTIIDGTNNHTVVFNSNKIFRGAVAVTVKELVIDSATNGTKTITATATSLGARTGSASSSTIVLDTVAPAFVNDGFFVASSNVDAEGNPKTSIYPHTSTSASGNVKISGNVYFYTKDSIDVSVDISDTNRRADNADLYLDSTSDANPVAGFTAVAPGSHKVYSVDRAGNKSVEKTFYVVADTTAPAAFDGYVTFTMPAGGNIYRGNADTDSNKNYVLKSNSAAYNIIVKLPGLAATDVDVGGSARTVLGRYSELDSLAASSPIEYYAFSMGTSPDGLWQTIGNGTITIPLASSNSSYTPYTIWLKDGCGNVSSYTVPVNWKIDGRVTKGSEGLSETSLYVNTAKGITYYKGTTTPLLSLTLAGDLETCFYPGAAESVATTTETSDYTLKSRVLAWPNNGTEPSYDDFYSTTIDSTRFTPWSYLTLKDKSSNVAMTHNYPKYETTSTNTVSGAYTLWYIIEDKLGNQEKFQLKNDKGGQSAKNDGSYDDIHAVGATEQPALENALSLWQYDNTNPTILVQAAGESSLTKEVNTIDGVNYFSNNSALGLETTDTQSGIHYDNVKDTNGNPIYYTGNSVVNSKVTEYSLSGKNPREDSTFKINGIIDYVQNVMSDSDTLAYNGVNHWLKQTHPILPDTDAATLDATYSGKLSGTATGTADYVIENAIQSDGSHKLKIQAPRSITGLTVNLSVVTKKIDSTGTPVDDDTPLLGWVVRNSALSADELAQFYENGNEAVQTITGNAYPFTKTDTSAYWNSSYSTPTYFYAVNRAGLICQKPIIVEFVENKVPAVTDRRYTNVTTFADTNYINNNSSVRFDWASDIILTKCEYYIDNSDTPIHTKNFASTYSVKYFRLYATDYAIDSNGVTSTTTKVIPSLTAENTFTVKLYTKYEESEKISLSSSSYSSQNKWTYDEVNPELKKIFVNGIKEATTDGTSSTAEYWATCSTNLTDVYITLKEENSGINRFNFSGSTINLTSSSKLYRVEGNSESLVNNTSVDTTSNVLSITQVSDVVRDSTGADIVVKISNVQLVTASSSDTQSARPGNKIILKISDCTNLESNEKTQFAIDSTTPTLSSVTAINGFNYDSGYSSLGTVTLSDRSTDYNLSLSWDTENTNPIYVRANSEYTNSRLVNASFTVSTGVSGLSEFSLSGGKFVKGTTSIYIGGGYPDFTIYNGDTPVTQSGGEGDRIVFNNHKVYRSTSSISVTIYSLQLLSGNDGSRTVSVTGTNIANRVNSTDSTKSDGIYLDTERPVWNDIGLYTIQTTTGIYPRSSNGSTKAYGVEKDGTIYFYTKGEIAPQIKPDITENNKGTYFLYIIPDSDPTNMFVSSVNLSSFRDTWSYFQQIPAASEDTDTIPSYSFTVYARDYAGNLSVGKHCTVIRDTKDPSAFDNRITFKNAMKDGVTAGTVFRANDTEYTIRTLASDVDPYKIIVKLGSGVDSTDVNFKGESISSRPTTAYTELYKKVDGTVNSYFNPQNSPIEYFAISANSDDPDGSYSSGWIPILDTTERTDNNYITESGGNEIIVRLPKARNCPTIRVHLKDGCGNVSKYRIALAQDKFLTWKVAGGLGEGNYSVDFKGNNYAPSGTADYVIMNSPYTGTSGTGNVAINTSKAITYYNKYSSTTPKLKLSYKTTCTVGTDYTGDAYSLRGRLIAGNWNGSAPGFVEFDSNDTTQITRKWATDWVPVKTTASDVAGEMEFSFPDSSVTAINGTSAEDGYELWYAVQDGVGYTKIAQVKNRTSSSSTDVTKWRFDAAGPTVDISTLDTDGTLKDVKYKKVNKIDTNYYYSDNSTVTYTIRDALSGVKTTGEASQTDSDILLRNNTSVIKYQSSRPYIVMYDLIGNSTSQFIAPSSTWTAMNTPDISEKANDVTLGYYYYYYGDKTGTITGSSNRGYNADNPASEALPESYQHQVKMKWYYETLTMTMPTMPSADNLMGWLVRTPDQLSASALDTSSTAFYTSTDIANGGSKTIDKDPTGYYDAWDATTYYFYAVNKAGLICSKPIEVSVVSNPIPNITGTPTYSTVTKFGDETINYVKTGSTVTIQTVHSPSYYHIEDESGTKLKDKSLIPSGNVIPLSFSTMTSNKELYLVLYTLSEESPKIALTGASGTNSWLYDATAPTFSMTNVTNANQLGDSDTDETYYVTSSSTGDDVTLTFSCSDNTNGSGIGEYKMSTNNGAWETIELSSDLKKTLTATTTKANYKFMVVDKAGNECIISDPVYLQKDIDAPTGTVEFELTKADNSLVESGAGKDYIKVDDTEDTNKHTIYYKNSGDDKVESAKISISNVSDNSGVGLKRVYYKVDNGTATTLTISSDDTYSISIDLSAGFEKTYTVYAEDKLGNTRLLKTYTFNGKNPTEGISYSKVDGDTDIIESENTKTIYFRSGLTSLTFTTDGLTDAAGNKVALYLDDAATAFVAEADITGTFSVTSLAEGTHTIIAKDKLGNKTEFPYVFNCSSPTGTITPKDVTGSVSYDTETNTVYYNASLTTLEFTTGTDADALKDARGYAVDLYLDSETTPLINSADISNNTITWPLPEGKLSGEHKITAKDSLGNKTEYDFKFNCAAPTGSITFDEVTGTQLVEATGDVDYDTIYFKHGESGISTLTLKAQNVKDAAGTALDIYRDSVTDQNNKIAVAADGTFTITCPGADATNPENSYKSEFSIVTVDGQGNQKTLKTYKLNGADPSGSVAYKFLNGESELTDNQKTAYVYESGNYVFYNKDYVTGIAVTVTNVGGWNPVSITATGASQALTGNEGTYTHTFTLPSSLEGTYTITATDGVGNAVVLKQFVVNGKAPVGSVDYATGEGVNANTAINTDNTKILFNSTIVTGIKFDKTNVADAANQGFDLYYKVGDGDLQPIGSDMIIPCPGTSTSYTATYQIYAKDRLGNMSEVLNTYEFNGKNPSGTITYTPSDATTAFDSATSTIYYKHGEGGVSSVTLTASVTDAIGRESITFYKGSVEDANKLESGITLDCQSGGNPESIDIIGVDSVGNQKTWTFNLNGKDPSASLNPTLWNVSEDSDVAASSSAYSLSGRFIYYNINSVKKLKVALSEPVGYNVSYKYQVGSVGEGGEVTYAAAVAITSTDGAGSCEFTLPTAASGVAHYKIIAVDGVGNETTLKDYVVEGNAVTGSVVFDDASNSSTKTKFVTSSEANVVYFKHGDNEVQGIKLKRTVEGDTSTIKYKIGDADAVDITSTLTLPLPGSDKNYTETYTLYSGTTIVAVYTLNGRSAEKDGTYNYVFPTEQVGFQNDTTWTAAKSSKNTESGDYWNGRKDGIRTYTYNPNKVNRIKFTPKIKTYGYDTKFILKINGTEQEQKYDVDNILALVLDSTQNGSKTYEFIVRDAVGNELTFDLKYKFVSHGTVPVVKNTLTAGYSGLLEVPTYPLITGTDEATGKPLANLSSSSANWIKGFNVDNNFKKTSGEYTIVNEPNEYYVVAYTNGMPNYDESNNYKYSKCSGWYMEGLKSNEVKFNLPVKPNSLPSSKLYYAVTYNDIKEPTTWSGPVDVKGSNDDGYIENVTIEKSKITARYSFIFVWYKDELGNICVHSLYTPDQKQSNNLFVNWWTNTDKANSLPAVAMQAGSNDRPDVSIARVASSGNWFTRGIAGLFNKVTGASSETIKTRSISLIPTEPDFTDTSADVSKAVKKSKKAAKKATKKAKKSAKKNSKDSAEMKEVTITIPSITENIALADTSAEVVDAVESTVSNLTSLGDAAVEQTEVEVLPEVQPESTAAPSVTPEAAAPVQSEPVEIEVDEETSKVIYIVFAVLLLVAGTAVFFITKKLLNRKK